MILGHIIALDSIESIPVSRIPTLHQTEVLELLSRILTKIETWGMSKALHDKWNLEGKMNQFFTFRHKWLSTSFNNPNTFDIPNNFNLFEDTILE